MPLAHSVSKLNSKSNFLIAFETGLTRSAAAALVLLFLQLAAPATARCAPAVTKAATVTSLAMSAGGKPVTADTQLPAGTVFTLTATVTAADKGVSPGQVNFCDATAKYCTDIHLLGSAQLTSAGIATLSFRPGIGTHSYEAVFVGTANSTAPYAGSISSTVTLTVTGTFRTSTVIAATGTPGNYALTATVTGTGSGVPLAGAVSFADSFNGNSSQASVPLGSSLAGLSFLNPQSPATGRQPEAVATGDFNGDGIADLAILNLCGADSTCMSGGSVTVLLGNGDGTFAQAASSPITVGDYPYSIVTGDFNGDGVLDLAVEETLDSNSGVSADVKILLGNGDGTFTSTSNGLTTSGLNPKALAIGDFNQDGIPDLAVSDIGDDTVTIYLGKGDGTFTQAGSPLSVGVAPESVAVGDFNGDGVLDLAVVNFGGGGGEPGNLTILLGKGDGTFTQVAKSSLTVGAQPFLVEVADLNGDGFPDLVVSGDTVAIYLGDGNGTFRSGGQLKPPAPLSYIAVGDYNQDGLPDLALATASGVRILLGNGKGGFTDGGGNSIDLYTFAVADFNGDGIPDLAGPNSLNTAAVLLSQLTETATATATSLSPLAVGTHQAVASYPGNSIYSSSAAGPVSLSVRLATPAVSVVASADHVDHGALLTFTAQVAGSGVTPAGKVSFNDGKDRLATVALENGIATFSTRELAIGSHSIAVTYSGDINYASATSSEVIVEVIPPASITLAVTASSKPVTSVAARTLVTLTASVKAKDKAVTEGQVRFCYAEAKSCTDVHLLGTVHLDSAGTAVLKLRPAIGTHRYKAVFQGTQNDAPATSEAVSLTVTGIFPTATALVQSGLAGKYTLSATVSSSAKAAPGPAGEVSFVDTSHSNRILAKAALGNTVVGPSLVNTSITPLSGGSGPIVAADFNGDGYLDLAVAVSGTSPSVAVLLGDGTGNFTKVIKSSIKAGGSPVLSADFNGDGIPDLLLASSSQVVILLGNGNGTFREAPGSPFAAGAENYPIVVADFNGDGIPDLAFAGYLSVYLGKGNGSFVQVPSESSQIYQAFFNFIAVGDFNGDGIPDLAVPRESYSNSILILLGNGDGTFRLGPSFTASGGIVSTATTGDFNQDGILDLAVASGDFVHAYLGKGDGTFKPGPVSRLTLSSSPFLVTTGDFNGDGIADLFLGAQTNEQAVNILLGKGDGTFSQMPIGSPEIPCCSAVAIGDFNGDGLTDIAASDFYDGTATMLLTQFIQASTSVSGIAAIGPGMDSVVASYPGSKTYAPSTSGAVQLTAVLAPVVFTPTPGAYTEPVKVTMSELIPGATIYYQAFGIVNTNGYVQYTGPFFLPYGGEEYIYAYATKTGYQESTTTSAIYSLDLPAAPKPTFSLAAGSYSGPQTVTITDTAPDAKIYYTTNGSVPSVYSTPYAGPIAVSSSELVAAVAIAPGYSQSSAVSAQYLIGSSKSRFIYTIAGTQSSGHSGDGGPATFASLEGPYAIARDANGNLYFGDGAAVRKVAAGTGIISTVAGNGRYGYAGDGGKATNAQIDYVEGVAIDAAGDLYISDDVKCVVRKVTASNGLIATIAGNGSCKNAGDGGPAVKASLQSPAGLAVDRAGNLYIGVDGFIRKVAPNGSIAAFAGNGFAGYSGDNGPALKAELALPLAITFDAAGNLFFADGWEEVVRKIAAVTSTITTVAGVGPQGRSSPGNGDGGPATQATLAYPEGLAVDGAGDLFISDSENDVVREVTASNKIIDTIAGSMDNCDLLGGDGGPVLNAGLCFPSGLAIDSTGNLYLVDGDYARVREITAPTAPPTTATAPPVFSLAEGTYPASQTLTVTAASGAEVYITLDGSTPTTSGEGYYAPITITGPVTVHAIALEPGHLPSSMTTATYDVTAPVAATIATIAGSGTFGAAGGPALKANLGYLYDVASDSAGNLYIADPENGVVWKLTAGTQTIAAFAGTPGLSGTYQGEGGPATQAVLGRPQFLALDAAGDVFISDLNNERILKVSAKTGDISTYAGGGQPNNYPVYGDGGQATSAFIGSAEGIAFDKSGNLYIADGGVGRIRMVNATTGIITSVVGTTGATSLGDGGPATKAMLGPLSMAFDGSGNLYIADRGNARIRMVAAKTQIITTVAGNGVFGSGGDGGSATSATIGPWGMAINAAGTIYFSNVDNTVREFVPGGKISTIAGTGYFGFSGDGGPARMGELCGIAGIAADKTGNLLIADSCNYRIRKVSFTNAAAGLEF